MVVRFGGNDYLDLARDPRVIEAAGEALRRHGASTCASRVSVGTIDLHLELEAALASFLGVPAVAVLASGYLAALAAFDALHGGRLPDSRRPRVAHVDRAAHPALLAGARASGVELDSYGSPGDLRGLEPREASNRASLCVATDGVEGFSGCVLPLDEIVGHARAAGLPTLVDDAHGIGVLGPEGRGSCACFGLDAQDGDLLIVGSLGKALASTGGFVAGSRDHLDAVRAGPSYRGSTAIAPSALAAAGRALQILGQEPGRRSHVVGLAGTLKRGLEEAGAPLVRGESGDRSLQFPVATLRFADASGAAATAAGLAERGLEVAHFAYASDASSAMLRIPLSARHRLDDVERLLEVLAGIRLR